MYWILIICCALIVAHKLIKHRNDKEELKRIGILFATTIVLVGVLALVSYYAGH